MSKKKLLYNLLEFIIPFTIPISMEIWKKLCLKKHSLAHELNIY